MEDLYNIIKKLNDNFRNIQEILPHMEKVEYSYKYKNLKELVDTEFNLFLKNNLTFDLIIKKITWGTVVNLDLLADFLDKTIYTTLPSGTYKNNEIELNKVKEYQLLREREILDTFFKFSFINLYINFFVMFVRKNYDLNFFNKAITYKDKETFDMQIKMQYACTKILRFGRYFYSKDLKTADDVYNAIQEEKTYKGDLLSYYIDSEVYSSSCISEYNILLEDLNNFLNLVDVNSPKTKVCNEEIEIYIEFANDLKVFINERINSLSCNIIKK